MLRLLYLYRNLTRNTRRTLLTCAAVALPIMIFVLSMAVVDGIALFLETSEKQLRLAVTQKTSIINPLPAGHRRKIEALDPTRKRIIAVCGMKWIGGQIENNPQPLSTLVVDADTFAVCFPELRLTPDELAAWDRDRQALVVGRNTATQLGWKVGDRVTIMPSLPPYNPVEFHVISTAPDATDYVTVWGRLDYYEEELKKTLAPADQVGFIFVKCASKADVDHFRQAIDERFANTPDETKTQDEKTFMNEFISQQFDLPTNLTILAALTVFVATMAAANTMSMNFRDRGSETAVLKALGFSNLLSWGLVQAESMLVCAVGGLIGAAIPYIAFTFTPLRRMTVPLIQTLVIEPTTCAKALVISLGIGVLAALWPAWQAHRMRVVTALRSLE